MADFDMWSHFLKNYNGKSVLLPEIWSSSGKELLFTDASGSLGFAAGLASKWFALGWEKVPNLAKCQKAIKSCFLLL